MQSAEHSTSCMFMRYNQHSAVNNFRACLLSLELLPIVVLQKMDGRLRGLTLFKGSKRAVHMASYHGIVKTASMSMWAFRRSKVAHVSKTFDMVYKN